MQQRNLNVFLILLMGISNREIAEDGKELLFDHGAPYFTVSSPDVLSIVREWESQNLCAEWREGFGIFDCFSNQFTSIEQVKTPLLF